MDIRKYFSRKRALDQPPDYSDEESDHGKGIPSIDSSTLELSSAENSQLSSSSSIPAEHASSGHSMSKSEKKKAYKAKLSYKKQWEIKYPWVYCTDVTQGMFCKLCQQ